MPGAVIASSSSRPQLLRFTNCQALQPDGSLPADISTYSLHVDPVTGKIVDGQSAFFDNKSAFTQTVNLDGDYLVPGFIDAQINGGYGVDFSDYDNEHTGNLPDAQSQSATHYLKRLDLFAQQILETGVTSFVPTIITQKADVYRKILPLLAPRSRPGQAHSLGYHCEGPFLSPHKKGAHCSSLIKTADEGMQTLDEVYGTGSNGLDMPWPAVKLLTLAPEVDGVMSCIPDLVERGVTVSIGHTASGIDTALKAKESGANFITHLFNAMGSFNHRDPGVIGLLGDSEHDNEIAMEAAMAVKRKSGVPRSLHLTQPPPKRKPRPFYGLIADGFHCHPCSVRMAYSAHPAGCVLVSDAMPWMDPRKPDGVYPWREGQKVVKKGNKVTLEGTETLAGSVVPISDCVTNLAKYASVPIHTAAYCASSNPAKMLGLQDTKGFLRAGCDADLVRLDKVSGQVKETWVAGRKVWSREEALCHTNVL